MVKELKEKIHFFRGNQIVGTKRRLIFITSPGGRNGQESVTFLSKIIGL